MQSLPDAPAEYIPALHARFAGLIWSCLDQDLPRSAVFYAERYFALDQENHDARHLYSTALLRAGQTHSALCAVSQPRDKRCTGCEEIRAKCLTTLGRFRDALEALEHSLNGSKPPNNMSTWCCKLLPADGGPMRACTDPC
jgi:anaphase-promoting complex subunit 3